MLDGLLGLLLRVLKLVAQRSHGLPHVAKLRLCCVERVLLLDHVK